MGSHPSTWRHRYLKRTYEPIPVNFKSQENHEVVVRYLLAHGANQALATEDGFTPLAVALQQGHDRIVALLLENDNQSKVKLPGLYARFLTLKVSKGHSRFSPPHSGEEG
jgi:ankyrin repeat protein